VQRRNADVSHSKGRGGQSIGAVPNGMKWPRVCLPLSPRVSAMNPIKRQQMEDRLHEIEEEIARAEAAIAAVETELQSFV